MIRVTSTIYAYYIKYLFLKNNYLYLSGFINYLLFLIGPVQYS